MNISFNLGWVISKCQIFINIEFRDIEKLSKILYVLLLNTCASILLR